MKSRTIYAVTAAALLLALLGSIGSNIVKAQSPTFASPAFQQLWNRTDGLVASGAVKRGYYWGPQPNTGPLYEDYTEGVNGKRLVQYFDKSRMEINNPNGNPDDPFYVTNGLLTEELITGKMQVGNNSFVQRDPAAINIASDPEDNSPTTPTYASFGGPIADGTDDATSGLVYNFINRDGTTGYAVRFANTYNIRYAYYETATRHNIPSVFWTFLTQSGPVIENGQQVNDRLSNPYYYVTGYPISEAYWATVTIAGQPNTDVLIQPFERRVLTYVPSAPNGYKVQMGNIGQHYYAWRYLGAGATPTPPPAPTMPPPTFNPNSCDGLPKRGFGKLWGDNPPVQQELGCSYGNESAISVAQQSFQYGQMIDLIWSKQNKTIYVLYGDGTLQQFNDDYVDGSPVALPTPPPGFYQPEGGFAKLWLEQTAAKVREKLGWATGHVTVDVANDKGQGGGAVQNFENGMMVYSGPTLKKIYVLYKSKPDGYGSYRNSPIDRWAVYDDTFQG